MEARRIEALRKAGIIPEHEGRLSEAQAMLDADLERERRAKTDREKKKRLDTLQSTKTPDRFRKEARRLLLIEPDLTAQVLEVARRNGLHLKRDKGGGRLNAQLIQLRDSLRPNMSVERKRELVDELFPNK